MRLEERLSQQHQSLLRYAHVVDILDRITALATGTLEMMGAEYALLGKAVDTCELALIKAPYVHVYLQKTGDYDALALWLPKEIFGTMVPFGQMVDLFNAYKNRTRRTLEELYEGQCLAEPSSAKKETSS
jgi:hypothetical protein